MPNLDTLSIQFNANGTERAIKNIKAMGYAVRSLANSIKMVDASKLSAFTSAMASLKGSVPTNAQTARMVAFANSVHSLNTVIGSANISGFSKDMATLGDAVQTFKKSSVNSIANAATAMQKLKVEAKDTATSISQAVSMSGQSPKMESGVPDIKAAKTMIKELDRIEIKATGVTGILQKMGIVKPSKGFKSLADQADKVRNKYQELRTTLQKSLDDGSIKADTPAFQKKMAELDALRNKYDELIQKQKELSREGSGFTLAPGLKQAASSAKAIDSSFRALSGALGTVSKKFSSIISKVRSFGSHAKSTKRDTSSLADAAKKLSNEFFRVSKMLKLMITRMALRAVIKELGNGFKSLALHSEEFNQSVSGIMNASKQLGYSISAMVSPLINAFAPAIIYVINLLIKLANVIQQVFGALTGATTWNKAKDFTESWADNIKAANKGAKELKKTVLGFDELNQLQEKTSGGGGGNDIVDMFDTQQIDPKWKSLADTIKKYANKLFDPIKKAWEKVGDFVKKSWKYAMDEVLKLGSSVARDFWKMWEQRATQQIFENILKIIGYIGQTVGNLARNFRKAWDENNTGFKILCNIRDIVLTITEHLKNMAKATADWADTLDFSPILTKFNEWLESLKPVVDNLMGIIEDFYTTVILPLGKWAAEEGGPQLLQVFIDFNNKVDWDGLRDKLKTLWEHLEPFMETVGEGLIIFIRDVSNALADFLNSKEFEDFLKDVEDWMDSVTPQDVADGLKAIAKAIAAFAIGKAVVDGLVAISGFLKLVASLAPVLKLSIVIATAYAGLKLGGLLGKWLTGDEKTYDTYTIPVMLEWTVEELPKSWDDFTDKLKDWADGWMKMRQEAETFIQICARIVEGPLGVFLDLYQLAGGFSDFSFSGGSGASIEADEWQKTIEAAKEATDKVNEHKNTLDDFKSKAESLKGTFESTGNEAKSFSEYAKKSGESVSSLADQFVNTHSNVQSFGDTLKRTSESTSLFKDAINNASGATPILAERQKGLADALSKTAEQAKANVQPSEEAKKALDNLKLSGDTYVNATPKFTKAQQDIATSLAGYKKETEEVTLATTNAELKMSGSWKELSKTTSTEVDSAKKSVDESMKDINKSLDTVKDAMSEKEWTFDGVGEGLTKTFEKAKKGIKGIWNSIADTLNGEHDVGGTSFHINLPRFARGGFPEDGLFMANHHELVGSFSNGKTAVANNQQIIAGIESGVYNAMVKANGQGGDSKYIANEIIVDGEVLARSVTKAQEKQNRRYSPSMA